jgi:hypothetical protein
LVLLAFPVGAQESIPLGTLKLDLNRLKTWGTREYAYEATHPGSPEKAGEGRIVLRTEVGPDSVTLVDTAALIYRGKELSLRLTHQCGKDNSLSPQRIESKGEGDDEVGTFVAKFDDGKAIVRMGDRNKEIELPDGTVSNWALFRIVTLLPRDEGTRISFDNWLESEELHLKKDFMIECIGREAIGEKAVCTKYRLTGGGNHPAYYWVDDDDVLRQVVIDERKWIRLRDESDEDE